MQLSEQTKNIVQDSSEMRAEVGLCKWWQEYKSAQCRWNVYYCTLLL